MGCSVPSPSLPPSPTEPEGLVWLKVPPPPPSWTLLPVCICPCACSSHVVSQVVILAIHELKDPSHPSAAGHDPPGPEPPGCGTPFSLIPKFRPYPPPQPPSALPPPSALQSPAPPSTGLSGISVVVTRWVTGLEGLYALIVTRPKETLRCAGHLPASGWPLLSFVEGSCSLIGGTGCCGIFLGL